MEAPNKAWIDALAETFSSYRRMIDGSVSQLSDAELGQRPGPGLNSVAIILRHLGGNLRSRWSDFLTTDGEKPDRNREGEFVEWDGNREALMKQFDDGWAALTTAIAGLDENSLAATIQIRGEALSVPVAILRSLTHLSYHVGQIMMIARSVHDGEWKWLTIKPGNSPSFNQQTWGTAESRGAMGKPA